MKRELLRSLLLRSGLVSLRWRFLRPHLYCFNYHRIGNPAESPFDQGLFSCTQERLMEHVGFLRDRFEVITLGRVLELLECRATSKRPLALITFDDGYADNYTLAFPVLKDAGVSASFFIPTAFVGGTALPWWDVIAWTLRNASVDHIRLRGLDKPFDLRDGSIASTTIRVMLLVKSRRSIPMQEQLEEIREACRPRGQISQDGRNLFLNWDQIREMHSAGMDIGSHTHSHPILSHIDEQAQETELARSKAILDSELGCNVTGVAYPVGWRTTFTPETCRIARSVGYRLGFLSSQNSANDLPLVDGYQVRRFSIDRNEATTYLKCLACFPRL